MMNTFFKSLFVMFCVVWICRGAQIQEGFDENNPLDDYSVRPTIQRNQGGGAGSISISSANAAANSLAINGSIATSNSQALALPQNLNSRGKIIATATATATATAIAKDGSISTATATASATAIAKSPVLAGRFIAGDMLFDIDDYSIYFPGCNDNRAEMNYNEYNKQFKCGQFDGEFQGCDIRYKHLRDHLTKTKKITFENLIFYCRDQNNNQLISFKRYNRDRDGKARLRRRIRRLRRYINRKDFDPQLSDSRE